MSQPDILDYLTEREQAQSITNGARVIPLTKQTQNSEEQLEHDRRLQITEFKEQDSSRIKALTLKLPIMCHPPNLYNQNSVHQSSTSNYSDSQSS